MVLASTKLKLSFCPSNSVLKPIVLYQSSIHLIENIDEFVLNPVNVWMKKKESDNELLQKNVAQAKRIELLEKKLLEQELQIAQAQKPK